MGDLICNYCNDIDSSACPDCQRKLTMNNIEYWDDFYPEGWRKIVYQLYADIEAISPGHSIRQIKEKFGGLRYYCGVDDYSKVDDLITKAANESMRTCQVCGNPGELINENYWVSTLCEEHKRA